MGFFYSPPFVSRYMPTKCLTFELRDFPLISTKLPQLTNENIEKLSPQCINDVHDRKNPRKKFDSKHACKELSLQTVKLPKLKRLTMSTNSMNYLELQPLVNLIPNQGDCSLYFTLCLFQQSKN